MKKTLNISGRTVTVDVTNLSKGICDMHNECKEKKAMLSFGMLDAGIMDMFESRLSKSIKKEFSKEANALFKSRIDAFIKDCNNEIGKGVYSFAEMVV